MVREGDCKWLGLLGVTSEERIAKPLYGLTPVSRVRIPLSPPLPSLSITYKSVIPTLIPVSVKGHRWPTGKLTSRREFKHCMERGITPSSSLRTAASSLILCTSTASRNIIQKVLTTSSGTKAPGVVACQWPQRRGCRRTPANEGSRAERDQSRCGCDPRERQRPSVARGICG